MTRHFTMAGPFLAHRRPRRNPSRQTPSLDFQIRAIHLDRRQFTLVPGCDRLVEPVLCTDEPSVLMIGGNLPCLRARPAHFVRHLPLSLQRWAPLQAYANVQKLFAEYPEFIPTIVGIDFANVEQRFPPKNVRPLFEQIARDNQLYPERALDIVYHVGEEFFDKSVESAIRWCHEIAEMGALRLGHAIALGLDPDVATQRRPQAHINECVSERLDQIEYDLQYQRALRAYNVEIDEKALLTEREALQQMQPEEQIERLYSKARFEEIHRRQQFVLARLRQLGTVIECCPTSNLRIGGVPDAKYHPVHRFLASNVNLVICTDDPGNFDITLSSEVDWVLRQTKMNADTLAQRLGDPRRFRLGQRRKRD